MGDFQAYVQENEDEQNAIENLKDDKEVKKTVLVIKKNESTKRGLR